MEQPTPTSPSCDATRRPTVQVKAAGGIRTLDALLEVRALGVTRVGATRTAEMLNDCRQRLGLPAIAAQTATPAGY